MPRISLIAAIDENQGLGKNNQLLCHLPADLAHFKHITMGKPIIMGRKTFASIGKALPGRLNIVVSTSQTEIDNVKVVPSLPEALQCAGDVTEVMIIGGAQLFQTALPIASRLYLTIIHHRFAADVFFPAFELSHWHCYQQDFRPADARNAYDLTFAYYDRISE